MVERQELYCHGCDKYVQFDVDLSLNGNHQFACPVCGHMHYRFVKNGKITDIRCIAGYTIYTISSTSISTSTSSTYTTLDDNNTDYDLSTGTSTGYQKTGEYYIIQSWMNTTTNS